MIPKDKGIIGGEENISKQPPNLSVQNRLSVKTEHSIKRIARVDGIDGVNQDHSNHDKEHQVANPNVPVAVEETLHASL